MSQVYLILNNPFYYGEFEWPEKSGTWYKGAHEPLITQELFDQVHIGRMDYKGKYNSKSFPFKRLLTCGKCGSSITAEEKFKLLKDGTYNRHVYYTCAKGKNRNCDQKYINENDLKEKILQYIIKNSDNLKITNELGRVVTEHHRIIKYHLQKHNVRTDNLAPLAAYADYVISSPNSRLLEKLVEGFELRFVLQEKDIVAT